jgi:hypothetical protein
MSAVDEPRVDITVPPAERAPLVASYRTDLVTALLGVWFTVGLLLDAWAHNNVPELETFFTPWHAAFYSGFTATAAWILWTCRYALPPHPRGTELPVGYRTALLAVGGFAVAAVGDMLWHVVFGVEQTIDILFSPTHLGLVVTMFVIVTTPLRSAWGNPTLAAGPGLRVLLPAMLATALAATLVLLFVQYANALAFDSGNVVVALSDIEEDITADLVSSMAVTNLILVVPLLALARRWTLPFGTATILYTATGCLSAAVAGFENAEMVIAFVVTGVGVDLLARWLRPTPDRPGRYRAFGFLAPLLTWAGFVATAYATAPMLAIGPDGRAPEAMVEVYTGAPLVQAMVGLLMAVLLGSAIRVPHAPPAAPPASGPPPRAW